MKKSFSDEITSSMVLIAGGFNTEVAVTPETVTTSAFISRMIDEFIAATEDSEQHHAQRTPQKIVRGLNCEGALQHIFLLGGDGEYAELHAAHDLIFKRGTALMSEDVRDGTKRAHRYACLLRANFVAFRKPLGNGDKFLGLLRKLNFYGDPFLEDWSITYLKLARPMLKRGLHKR